MEDQNVTYGMLLYDFMHPEGDKWGFLKEQEWETIHRLGDGVHELYRMQKKDWDRDWEWHHVQNSSLSKKKKMADTILEIIIHRGGGNIEINEPETVTCE